MCNKGKNRGVGSSLYNILYTFAMYIIHNKDSMFNHW